MQPMYYIGLDVHKRKISYCVKDPRGAIHSEGSIPATRFDLDRWMRTLPQPWSAAIEATMFTGWIYDHLKPHAAALKVAHPLMLRAIAAAKKKNDRIDANKICDCLRCDFLPECYMASTAIRERRRTLRYRNLLVRQMVQMKIKISALLMEAGVSYNKQRLHKAGYFRELLATNPHIDEGLRVLLRQCREMVVRLGKTENALIRSLRNDRFLAERVERLMSIPAVGPITALTWALEIGEVQPVLVDQEGRELLWPVWRPAKFGRSCAAYAAVQTAEQAFADDPDRSRQDGAALQPDTGHALRPREAERQRQSRDAGGGTEAGRLPDGRGSWPDPFSRGGPRGRRGRLD
jgi:transposase